MRESNSAERTVARSVASGRFSFEAEEKSGLRVDECVSETVEHNTGDVAPGVEAGPRKHVGELLADLTLVVGERRGQQLRAAHLTLSAGGKSRLREIDEKSQHRRQIRTRHGRIHA